MPEKNKTIPILLNKLDSSNLQTVLDSIEELRKEGNELVTKRMIDLLAENRSEEISKSAYGFLCDIRHKESGKVFIQALRNKEYNNIMYSLVSACWQNSIDFRDYLTDFVDIVINMDFLIAFEAFTVIEEIAEDCSPDKLESEIIRLKTAATLSNEEKQALIVELVNVLGAYL